MAKAKRVLAAIETAQKTHETRNEKFRRLANFRTKRIISDMRSLARLGSDLYERKPEQIRVIAELLEAELKAALDALRRGQERPKVEDII